MTKRIYRCPADFCALLRGFVFYFILPVFAVQATPALWTGPNISYSQPSPDPTQPANQDRLTSLVWLTRAQTQGLYNAVTETQYDKGPDTDPTDTEWAYGSIDNYTNLTYTTWANMSGGNPPSMVGQPAVLHLITNDIYISITFTFWGGNAGGFAYVRSTPAVTPPPPTVNITKPVSGAAFAAPANVYLGASASVAGGTVTNVQFFTNGVACASVAIPPFTLTASNLAAASYMLTAVATASGISATSGPVNISVVNPSPVNLSVPVLNSGQISFNYNVNPGLSYAVESSSNLLAWVPVVTNTPTVSPAPFSASTTNNGALFYRVARLPNP